MSLASDDSLPAPHLVGAAARRGDKPRGATIAVVDDHLGDCTLVEQTLAGYADFHFEHLAQVGDLARYQGGTARPDVVLLDLNQPGLAGRETLDRANRLLPDVPIVVLSSGRDERLTDYAVERGCQGFIDKGHLSGQDLSRHLKFAIALGQRSQRFVHQANYDYLTGLANRSLFLDRLGHAMERSARSSEITAVLLIDIDDFKLVNDSHGHDVGDGLLRAIAEQLRLAVRQSDTVGRMGGDEFVILLEGVQHPHAATAVASKLLRISDEPLAIGPHHITAGLSIGIALHASDGRKLSPEALIKRADTALYRAKLSGKRSFHNFTDELDRESRERYQFDLEVSNARDRDELQAHYQPIVDPYTQRLHSIEMLIRWHHNERGVLLPDAFLPSMARLGILESSCMHVLGGALRQYRQWRDAGLCAVKLAFNVDAHELDRPTYASHLETMLADTGVDPDLLQIELTEHTLLKESAEVAGNLARLKALGVGLVIDDFGMGYGSFSYLKRLTVDGIKLDRSITAGLPGNTRDLAITRALARFAAEAGLTITAEGVENRRQLYQLQGLSVDYVQGYLLGRPLPATAFAALYCTP